MSSEAKKRMLHNQVERALKYCEAKEELLYKELVLLLKSQNIEIEVITAIEDIYIKKGIIYCETAFEMGFNTGANHNPLLTS